MKPARFGTSLPLSILILALVYYLTGRLGLLLAIPPGYATAIWPASGIALAALLLYGYRLWPGILLGSFLVNLSISFDGSSALAVFTAVSLALSVGVGASLQALLGTFLIRRFTQIDLGLLDTRSVFGFLGLGGPLSCLVNATWGVTTLWLFDRISLAEYPFSWMNWWVGDTIGVIIFLPLTFVLFGRPLEVWRWRKSLIIVPLLMSVAAVVGFFAVASDTEQKRIEADFQQRTEVIANSFEKNWIRYIEVLYSIQGLLNITDYLDSDKFRRFVSHILERTPGIQAVSWNPVVADDRRDEFEAGYRERGLQGFQIRERDRDGKLIEAGERPEYVVVKYIEPYLGNETALGFDVYSDPRRKRAMDLARDMGEPVATSRIDLVQETTHQAGILVFQPVYRTGDGPTDIALQREELLGFVVGVFRMGDVLATALQGLAIAHTDTLLIDETQPNEDVLLAAYRAYEGGYGELLSLSNPQSSDNQLTWSDTLHVGGREWRLVVTPSSQYLTQHRSWAAWGVLVGGLMLTGLLGSFLLILTGGQIVERQRSEELAGLNRHLNSEVATRQKIEQSLREVNERLKRLATVDHLTGAFNRHYIQDFANRAHAEMRRYQQPYSIIMFDLDHFKRVNDRFGHSVGDQALQEVSRMVAEQLRETDCLGRWGGEEFLIVAKQTNIQESKELGQRLCRTVGAASFGDAGVLTISVGVACNTGSFTLEEVIKNADEALYLAKHKGRNRVETHC